MGHVSENIVHSELVRRDHEVHIGKVGDAEVNFIAVDAEGEGYCQISQTVLREQTLERGFSSLDAIKDRNPRYLLTMDYVPLTSYNDVKQVNVLEWLLKR